MENWRNHLFPRFFYDYHKEGFHGDGEVVDWLVETDTQCETDEGGREVGNGLVEGKAKNELGDAARDVVYVSIEGVAKCEVGEGDISLIC